MSALIWRMDDIDRIMLLESVEVVGVRMLPLSSKMMAGPSANPTTASCSSPVMMTFPQPGGDFATKFRAMTEFAVDRLGCPYNAEEIGMIAATIGAGMAGIEMPAFLNLRTPTSAPEYADICYQTIGTQIARKRPNFIAPADFANDAK